LSKVHASSDIAHVEFKENFKFSVFLNLGVFFDASTEQFAYDNEEEKEAILQGGVLKTRQTVLFSLHLFEVIAISVQIDTISLTAR
jgi:hypothetical protein